MKIKDITAVSMLAAACVLGGCGDKTEMAVPEPEIEQIEEQALEDSHSAAKGENAGEQDTQETEQETEEKRTKGALTEGECMQYTAWLQEYGNYGFLLSDWSVPEEISLWEVCYSGAGISESPTQEQIDSYLARTGQEELYTDFFVIPKSSLSDFLLKKVGLSYEELLGKGNTGMEEAYDPEQDCFDMEVGDTNYMQFTVESGERRGDGVVSLRYRSAHMWDEETSWIEAGIVELIENGTERQFLSNHITEGTILEMEPEDTAADTEAEG